MRIDNDLEYLSNEFNSFCQIKRIFRQKTIRETSQQNGLAERMNMTILERVRCMLPSSELPKSFWIEVIITIFYSINISPYSAINLKTPQQMWSGKTSRYNHLRIFGCTA